MTRKLWPDYLSMAAVAVMAGVSLLFVVSFSGSAFPSSLRWSYGLSQSIQMLGPLTVSYGAVVARRAWASQPGDVLRTSARSSGRIREVHILVTVQTAVVAYLCTAAATLASIHRWGWRRSCDCGRGGMTG